MILETKINFDIDEKFSIGNKHLFTNVNIKEKESLIEV